MKFLMVLKLPAILPSGSAGKFLKKFEFGKKGEEAILLPYYDPPISAECQHGQQIPSALEPQGIQQSTKSQQTANKFVKKYL